MADGSIQFAVANIYGEHDGRGRDKVPVNATVEAKKATPAPEAAKPGEGQSVMWPYIDATPFTLFRWRMGMGKSYFPCQIPR